MIPAVDVELAHPVGAELGEGPVWDSTRRCLWFVDIMRGRVHRFAPIAGAMHTYEIDQPVGALVPESQAELVWRALENDWDEPTLATELAAQAQRRRSSLAG